VNEQCEFYQRCGKSGHYQDVAGVWKRCPCLEKRVHKNRLGIFYSDKMRDKTPLSGFRKSNLLIEGPLATIKEHLSRVLTEATTENSSWRGLDAYRLIEIFLEKDKELQATSDAIDCDLFILMLGFGDPRNKYLPELILQALKRREMQELPTWVILGIDLKTVMMKYSNDVYEAIKGFKAVKAR